MLGSCGPRDGGEVGPGFRTGDGMRVRRPLSIAVGSCAVAAALTGSTSVAAAGGAATLAGQATVLITPGVVHSRDGRSAPPSTAYCEQHYQIACYQPFQLQAAYNLSPLFKKGITGK